LQQQSLAIILKMRQAILKVKLLKTGIFVLMTLCRLTAHSQSIPLPNAFAHNDYFHKRPLYDALDNGYANVEADIFLQDDKLVVAHIYPFFKDGRRELEDLYFKPLFDRIAKNEGQVYKGYDCPITLMIDIKTDAVRTYRALKPLLEKYRSILTRYEDGKVFIRPVTVVLSGNKPYDMIKAETKRLAFIDANLKEATRDTSYTHVYAMASCKYSNLIRWNGTGEMPRKERSLLKAYVETAHKYGKKVRLWASPDNKTVWQELLNCGVDLINTDKLSLLKDFLLANTVVYANSN
jgi:hypothetical protein